ncbi:MAG: glycolate oxidase subunit GlcF [Proteobacteria bacterium]|nr:glycolate oxidase subunit GlcF [Pseudomonadota bacterium]
MHTTLAPEFHGDTDAQAAQHLIGACVHCGFCTATCPTFQELGNENDSPRGRIDLIRQMLEGQPPTRQTQAHLDRCLTCRACETTCPSGVQYGQLVTHGRRLVDARVPRPAAERAQRWALKEGLTSPLFGPALKLGRALRPLLPPALKHHVPPAGPGGDAHRWPTREHPRKVLLLMGCVQPALAPNINSATARVLDAAGIQVVVSDEAGCCGALREHLSDAEGARADARRNVEAWWPYVVQEQVEAIVSNASGCGTQIADWPHLLHSEPEYAERARRIAALAVDVSHFLPDIVAAFKPATDGPVVAWHPPCSLQHGQRTRGVVEAALAQLGAEVRVPLESHLCCGSAGTYSVLQPELSERLRTRKLGHLQTLTPQVILSANVGCIQHLQAGTQLPVMHWVEWVDAAVDTHGSENQTGEPRITTARHTPTVAP